MDRVLLHYFGNLYTRIVRRITRGNQLRYPWQETAGAFLRAVRSAAKDMLAPTPPHRNGSVLKAHLEATTPANANGWHGTCVALGLATSARLKPDDYTDRDTLEVFLGRVIDEHGAFRYPLRGVDDCMVGYVALEMLRLTGSIRYRAAADRIAHYLLRDHPKTATGTLPYCRDLPTLVFVDTLGMVCPFLAYYGSWARAAEATSLAIKQLCEFLERGFDERTGLPFHACDVRGPERHGIIGWARGTGWVALGLANTLAHLSPKHPQYGFLGTAFRQLVEAAARYQTEQGCWRWTIAAPKAHLDTSGTAFIAYAIERGVEIGVLDTTWSEVSAKALTGVSRFTTRQGYIESGLADCVWLGTYPLVFGRTAWSQGLGTALAALVITRRSQDRSVVTA